MTTEEKLIQLEHAYMNLAGAYHEFAKITFEGIGQPRHSCDDWTKCTDTPCVTHYAIILRFNEGTRQ